MKRLLVVSIFVLTSGVALVLGSNADAGQFRPENVGFAAPAIVGTTEGSSVFRPLET
jgi:hypothetical protein